MRRRNFLKNAPLLGLAPALMPGNVNITDPFQAKNKQEFKNDRKLWLHYLVKLSDPVLSALAADQLKAKMPNEIPENVLGDRSKYALLEAVGRLLAGIASWLQLEEMNDEEKEIKGRFFDLAIKGLGNAANPSSKDYFKWVDDSQAYAQPLVDASFLAYAFVRCPKLWEQLDDTTKERIKERLVSTRIIKPGYNNWLLFSAMIESFFISIGVPYNIMRIDYALRQHEQWYIGDVFYSDGPSFHYDYYNSFVIHPYLHDIVSLAVQKDKGYESMKKQIFQRNLLYAAFQEEIIASDGTYPPIGRSIVYPYSGISASGHDVFKKMLPESINPAQARCALTAVISKITEPKDMYDENGWLTCMATNLHWPILTFQQVVYISVQLFYCHWDSPKRTTSGACLMRTGEPRKYGKVLICHYIENIKHKT